MQARLIPNDGGRPVRLEKELTIIGRKRWVCDVYLTSDRVSKLHAMIYRSQGRWLIQDLGSSNGTRINGQRLTEEAELRDSDEIAFANEVFQLEIHPAGPDFVASEIHEAEPVSIDETRVEEPGPPDADKAVPR